MPLIPESSVADDAGGLVDELSFFDAKLSPHASGEKLTKS